VSASERHVGYVVCAKYVLHVYGMQWYRDDTGIYFFFFRVGDNRRLYINSPAIPSSSLGRDDTTTYCVDPLCDVPLGVAGGVFRNESIPKMCAS